MRSDPSHGGGAPTPRRRTGRPLRRATTVLAVLVVLTLIAAGAAYVLDLPERWRSPTPSVADRPVSTPKPALRLPEPAPADPVATALAFGATADAAAVTAALGTAVSSPELGSRVSVAVAELGADVPLFSSGPRVLTPASTLKLLTTAAALEALGPEHRFTTSTVRSGRRLVLVGGGDPLLTRSPDAGAGAGGGARADYPARADLTTLARRTARALTAAGVTRVRLGYDASLFSGSAVEDTWEPGYVPDDVVSPIASLWVDEGRERRGLAERSPDPALVAATVFAAALRAAGVRTAGPPVPAPAPPGGTRLAVVESPPLAQIVEHVLAVSDNEGAEVLARHVALASGGEPSFEGGTAAIREVLARAGVRLQGAVIEDGSGLSRANRLPYPALLDVLALAAGTPRLRAVLTGLPVAGFSGSLASRFSTAPSQALGAVRAKTGTLTGVHGLAGTVMTRDGVLLSFVAMADRVAVEDTLDARATLDEIAGALAACRCRSR